MVITKFLSGARVPPSTVGPYLEGHRYLLSRSMMGTMGVILWLIGVIILLTESP